MSNPTSFSRLASFGGALRPGMVLRLACVFVLGSIIQLRGAPPPQVGFSSSSGQITLTWVGSDNWLQSADFLDAYSWMNVPNAPILNGGTNAVTLPTTQPVQFFRLVASPFLPPPTRLSLEAAEDGAGNNLFYLWWDEVPGAVSYNLYYAAAPGVTKDNYASLPQGATVQGITGPFTVVSNLLAGRHYYFVVTAVSILGESADSNEATGVFGPRASISGEVDTALVFGTNVIQVPLAGVSVTLSNLNDPTFVAQRSTDPDGLFQFDDQPGGSYQLCWSAHGFASGCYSNVIALSNSPVDVGLLLIAPVTNAASGLVWGQVRLQDGSPAVFQDSFYQINLSPIITLTDTNGRALRRVAPNSDGQYVMAGVPVKTGLGLSVQLEQASVSNVISTFVTGEADFVISNSSPVISNLVATLGGQEVYRVPPGATVHVTATAGDPDGDALQYQWFLSDGIVLPATGPQLDWTLPNAADGFAYLFLRVSDGFGGYATARLALTTNPYLLFSGQAVGSDTGLPLTNAAVQLSNLATNTDANGYFALLVTPTNEYDLAIASSGYLTLNQALFGETPDRQYVLQKIASGPCVYDSSQPIEFTNAGGVILYLPALSLTDTNGATYFGCVGVAVDTGNPCDTNSEFLGGDLTPDGSVLSPYAFVNVDVRGTNGVPLSLGPGNSMQLLLPQSAGCFDPINPPPGVQFFAAPVGAPPRWTLSGGGTRMIDNNGFPVYLVNVTNVNFPFPNFFAAAQPAPAKGSLQIVADATIHTPFTVFITPNGAPQLGSIDITLDENVVTNLPAGDAKITVLNPRQAPGEYYDPAKGLIADKSKDVIQLIVATVVAGQTVKVTVGLGSPAPTDNNKTRKAILTENKDGAVFTGADVPNFLNRNSKGASAARGDKYYKLIDPDNLKSTFTLWQQENGWTTYRSIVNRQGANFVSFAGNPDTLANSAGGDDEFALYFNANDLGAGRRMGMKIFKDKDKDGNNSVAYYVATYATLKDAENDQKLKYIVCMEYSLDLTLSYTNANAKPKAIPPATAPLRYVKFYAFNADGSRSPVVPDEAPVSRFVPYVCMVCHGGSQRDPTTNADVAGQFTGFDTANYTFSTKATFTHDNLFANAKMGKLPNSGINGNKNVFSSLNDGLLTAQSVTKIMPDSLNALVKALIAGNGAATTPPAGWNDATANANQLYSNVYAVSCRSCHSTQSAKNWSTAAGFLNKGGSSAGGSMPNAQRTYSIFWGSATGHKLDPALLSQPLTLSPDDTPPVK
jgi:hypothetical protein